MPVLKSKSTTDYASVQRFVTLSPGFVMMSPKIPTTAESMLFYEDTDG